MDGPKRWTSTCHLTPLRICDTSVLVFLTCLMHTRLLFIWFNRDTPGGSVTLANRERYILLPLPSWQRCFFKGSFMVVPSPQPVQLLEDYWKKNKKTKQNRAFKNQHQQKSTVPFTGLSTPFPVCLVFSVSADAYLIIALGFWAHVSNRLFLSFQLSVLAGLHYITTIS